MVINNYFKEIFHTTNPSHSTIERCLKSIKTKVMPTINEKLQQSFTCEKVLEALKQMVHLKSPGPNGFSVYSYHTYLHIIGKEVSNVVLNFLNEGAFDKYINYTYIVLILKVKNPVVASDFRPVSLCNMIYKLE